MRVIAGAHDPGGANAVAATVAVLRAAGEDVLAFAKGPALRQFAALGVDCHAVSDDHGPALRAVAGDVLLTGTSAQDSFERELLAAAACRGLPSLALVDYWANYRARFVPGAFARAVLPDLIAAIDDPCAAEMAADGLPSERIRVVGQPYFGWLIERRPRASAVDEHEVLFLSQPGQNEVEALRWVIAAVRGSTPLPFLSIRFHPRQGDRGPSLRLLDRAGLRYGIDDSPAPLGRSRHARAILGITTMMLAEAAIMGIPAGSVLAGVPDTLATNRYGLTTALRTPDEVAAFLNAPPQPRGERFLDCQRGAHRRAASLCQRLASGQEPS
jgi:hypothetical protein